MGDRPQSCWRAVQESWSVPDRRMDRQLVCYLLMVGAAVLHFSGCAATSDQAVQRGCEPSIWQQRLQLAAETQGYVDAGIAEVQLCIACPRLAKQMGVICTGRGVDFPPGWESAVEGSGYPDVPGQNRSDTASLKGPSCIVKCKKVYRYCVKTCMGWTEPLVGESAITCHDRCVKEEKKCLDACLGK